jgi:hypothetical protein
MNAIKGYRVKAGAVIRVFRGDRVRRYRVTARRFRALRMRFAGTLEWHGYFGSSTLDIYTWPDAHHGKDEAQTEAQVMA